MSKTIQLIKPGFLPTDPAAVFCRGDKPGHCSTCSAEALPAHVLEVLDGEGTAIVELDGHQTQIDISLVDGVQIGSWLLVHGGVALEHLAEVTE